MTNQRNFVLKIKGNISALMLGGMIVFGSILTNHAKAQDMQSSPLSRYGYGTLTDRSPIAWRGMGNVGIGMSSNKVINFKNPAAYAATDSLSFLLDIGGSINMGHYRDDLNSKTTFLGGFDYLAMQFPLYKDRVAMSLGVVPFTRTGYGLSTIGTVANGNENTQIVQTYRGSGSLQSAYLGVGARLFGGLSLGVNAQYYFGSLTHSYKAVPNDVFANQTLTAYTVKLSSFSVDLGMQYRFQLNNKTKDNLLFGLTYTPQLKVTPKLSYSINRSTSSNTSTGSAIVRPDVTSSELSPVSALPHQIGAGLSWNRSDRYTFAMDFNTSLWSKVPNVFTSDGVNFRDTYNISAGAEIKPDLYSRDYGKRVAYRFGVNYGTSYLNLDKVGNIQTIGASVGFGLPVDLYTSDRSSQLNLSLEYLHTMPQQSKLFSEDMLKLSVSLTFNETWFRKLKIY